MSAYHMIIQPGGRGKKRNAIIKDPRCVGIGEFGFDYFAHFSSYKTQQITLCRKFL